MDDVVARALAGPYIPFVQPRLAQGRTITLNEYAQLINPYVRASGQHLSSNVARQDWLQSHATFLVLATVPSYSDEASVDGDMNALVPPECWLGLENYQTLFPKVCAEGGTRATQLFDV